MSGIDYNLLRSLKIFAGKCQQKTKWKMVMENKAKFAY